VMASTKGRVRTRQWRRDLFQSDGQHKKMHSNTAKAPAHENQRLCLVPHTCRFLGRQSLGFAEPAGEGLVMRFLHPRPRTSVPRKGDASSTQKIRGRTGAFLRLCENNARFACGKRGLERPNSSRPQSCACTTDHFGDDRPWCETHGDFTMDR
jgi:hypothetical protein